MSKALCPQFQENPILLVENWVMYNCTKHDCEQAEWFNASVLRLAEVFPPGGGGGGTWVFFGWLCAARDPKLAPRSKKKFP